MFDSLLTIYADVKLKTRYNDILCDGQCILIYSFKEAILIVSFQHGLSICSVGLCYCVYSGQEEEEFRLM